MSLKIDNYTRTIFVYAIEHTPTRACVIATLEEFGVVQAEFVYEQLIREYQGGN